MTPRTTTTTDDRTRDGMKGPLTAPVAMTINPTEDAWGRVAFMSLVDEPGSYTIRATAGESDDVVWFTRLSMALAAVHDAYDPKLGAEYDTAKWMDRDRTDNTVMTGRAHGLVRFARAHRAVVHTIMAASDDMLTQALDKHGSRPVMAGIRWLADRLPGIILGMSGSEAGDLDGTPPSAPVSGEPVNEGHLDAMVTADDGTVMLAMLLSMVADEPKHLLGEAGAHENAWARTAVITRPWLLKESMTMTALDAFEDAPDECGGVAGRRFGVGAGTRRILHILDIACAHGIGFANAATTFDSTTLFDDEWGPEWRMMGMVGLMGYSDRPLVGTTNGADEGDPRILCGWANVDRPPYDSILRVIENDRKGAGMGTGDPASHRLPALLTSTMGPVFDAYGIHVIPDIGGIRDGWRRRLRGAIDGWRNLKDGALWKCQMGHDRSAWLAAVDWSRPVDPDLVCSIMNTVADSITVPDFHDRPDTPFAQALRDFISGARGDHTDICSKALNPKRNVVTAIDAAIIVGDADAARAAAMVFALEWPVMRWLEERRPDDDESKTYRALGIMEHADRMGSMRMTRNAVIECMNLVEQGMPADFVTERMLTMAKANDGELDRSA